MQTDRTTVGVRGRATRTHQQVKEIEAGFLAAWATISLMREFPLGEDLAATLIGDKVGAAANAAKQALDGAVKAKSPDVGKLRPAWPGSRKSAPCSTTRRRRSTTPIRGRCSRRSRSSRIGITDMPSWMVEAFAERGWQWGMWSGFADAMHFDYMGPVADVRSEAQYH